MAEYVFHGVTFYEHPTLGDQHPLLVKKGDEFYMTNLYDAPANREEALDEYESATSPVKVLAEIDDTLFEIDIEGKDNG